jgi:DNA polymerase III alpha subunit
MVSLKVMREFCTPGIYIVMDQMSLPGYFCLRFLNSQPMGFYQPAQIVADARNHNVELRPIDVNYSAWDNLLEEKVDKYHSLRLGFRQGQRN